MVQTELEAQGLKNVSELQENEIKNVEKAKHNADIYAEAYLGNMLFPGTPVKVLINNNEMYKVPVKSHYDKGMHILGYIYLKANTLEIDKSSSSTRDDIDKAVEEIIKNESSVL